MREWRGWIRAVYDSGIVAALSCVDPRPFLGGLHMDPIEILGSLLGQKAGGSGTGADILKQILLGGGSRREAPQSAPARTPQEVTEQDIDRQARELEDLLN